MILSGPSGVIWRRLHAGHATVISATSIPSRNQSMETCKELLLIVKGQGWRRSGVTKRIGGFFAGSMIWSAVTRHLSLVAMAFRGFHDRNPELHISVPEAPKADGVINQ